MKKLLLSICTLYAFHAYADQLAYLTKSQAEKTVKYLKDNKVKEIMLWCGCCTSDTIKKVELVSMTAHYTGYEAFYEVLFEYKMKDGTEQNKALDLAEVFVRVGDEVKCLGKVLKFECNPCTEPFKYTFYNPPPDTHHLLVNSFPAPQKQKSEQLNLTISAA